MTAAVASELTCRDLVELVTDYLEDRMPRAERRQFELHVCSCPGCRVYLAQMRAVLRVSKRLVEEDVPPGVREELLAAFRGWKGA